MLNQNNNRPFISHMQKDRMRYRGPIESQKINNFQQMFHKDIMNVRQQVEDAQTLLKQYATETFIGSNQQITIAKEEEVIFQGNDNKAIHEMIKRGGVNQWEK